MSRRSDEDRFRVALVAMPWSRRDRPSAALGALVPYVRRECAGVHVSCHSEFVEVAQRVGPECYDAICFLAYSIGELFYAPFLYPEQADNVRAFFSASAPTTFEGVTLGASEGWDALFERVQRELRAHVQEVADRLARSGANMIGLTTCFGQLFANLTLAKELKALAPDITVVLGGSTVSSRVGPSILAEYPFVDYIVQGEGERPLAHLINALRSGCEPPSASSGVLSRSEAPLPKSGANLLEVRSMDELPVPDFDEYAERADHHGIEWSLPLEGSRGCWWDRTKRTGDPKSTCYFCNLNIQWGGYREKSIERVKDEIEALSDRYRNLKIYFVDNIIRLHGVEDFALKITELGKDLDMFYEMRVNVSPYEFLLLAQAGLRRTQLGIEGLSTSYLQRIGKGSTVIQNLQAMRACTELGIRNLANLIVDFPGSTAAEVEETRRTIRDYALSFEPLSCSTFRLGVDSTVDALRTEFSIDQARNHDDFRHGLPDEVWSRIELADLSYTPPPGAADWTSVREACRDWQELHRGRSEPLLRYRDGGSFIVVEDDRFGEFRSGVFVGVERELYLYCMEARTRRQIAARFPACAESQLDAALAMFHGERLLYQEKERYLALAVAASRESAFRRISAEEARKRSVRLPVLAQPSTARPLAPSGELAGNTLSQRT